MSDAVKSPGIVNTESGTHPAVAAVSSYSLLRITLHWTLAAMVVFLFVSSWWMLSLPLPSADYTYRVLPFQLHKNIGITLFLITIAMFWLRLRERSPEEATTRNLMQSLADIDRWLIYGLIGACCLSGYLSSSYSGWDTEFWWLLRLPTWAGENDELNIVFSNLHEWTCWWLIVAIVLHIAAAIYHGLRNDGLLQKMFP